jgi:hypothetical protein
MTRHTKSGQRQANGTSLRAQLVFGVTHLLAVILLPYRGIGQEASYVGVPEPIYWRQREFFIPYQGAAAVPGGGTATKVRLAVARDGGANWTTLQEAAPNVRGFRYLAPADGEYAFAVSIVDPQDNAWPRSAPQPQLRVVVDTQSPTLRLTASRDFSGRTVVRYEANDRQLRPETLRIEAQGNGKTWEPLPVGPPDVSYPDRLLGQLTWKPPENAAAVRLRAAINDRAGNTGSGTADATLVSSLPTNVPAPHTQAGATAPAAVDWPADNAVAAIADPSTTAPPHVNPYTPSNVTLPVANAAIRTPSQLTATHGLSAQTLSEVGNVASAPSLLTADSRLSPLASAGDWTAVPSNSAPASGPSSVQWINSLTVDVDYDLQTVGPWGVAKVELWATSDGGQTWRSLGLDADNRSPFRATLPGAGVHGLRIIVEGINGSPAAPPQTGDQPELVLGVDIQPPQAEITGAKIGQGELADHLVINWSASDEHLTVRPVTLLVSETAQGPWSTVAADLANTGEYRWRLTREPPQKIFLRLEARDLAGNVATYQTPSPLVLILPQPTGRLRSVRPVTDDTNRDRTADRRP